MATLPALIFVVVVIAAIVLYERAEEHRARRTGKGYRDGGGAWIGPIPPRPNVKPPSQKRNR